MYQYFSGKEIVSRGWLLEQLHIQARGLGGHLDKIWPDIRDSAWIGGDREGWERVPYWLDGFIPLAYQLENEALITRAKKYMDAIMNRQQEDGWLCPCTVEERKTYDIWSLFLIGKVLALYADYSDDPRAEETLYKAFFNIYGLLKSGELTLFKWSKSRWFEALIPLNYLKAKRPEPWMDDLAAILKEQGAQYKDFEPMWEKPSEVKHQETHVVNIAMMLKYPELAKTTFGLDCGTTAEYLWQRLTETNGTAVGTVTGDEHLSGISPTRGTELCSVVELMYSFETLFALTDDGVWLDRLEKAALNALPATFTDDMWAHQYDQMVNQMACITFPEKSYFRTNNCQAHLFGLEPHFGCCTANFSQGWPKLAQSLYCRNDTEICATLPLPGGVRTDWKGAKVEITCDSEYPFRLRARWTVHCEGTADFALRLKKPGWAKAMYVNGTAYTADAVLPGPWNGETVLEAAYQDTPHLTGRPGDMKVAEYGPLVFSLPITAQYRAYEYVDKGVERKYPYCDYELSPQTEWEFAFAGEKMTVSFPPVEGVPFSSKTPSVFLNAMMVPIHWGTAEGFNTVAAPYPQSRAACGPARTVELIPYGCAKLRMTEIPMAEE